MSVAEHVHKTKELREALKNLLDRYVGLVESGDCGSWDPGQETAVKAAHAVLKATDPRPMERPNDRTGEAAGAYSDLARGNRRSREAI